MKHPLLAILLLGCSADPREADIVIPESLSADGQRALELWLSAEPDIRAHFSGECSEDRACIRIMEGGAPQGHAGWSNHHGNGDCDITTGTLKKSPMWRILAHELGHCFGLKHTAERCQDGAPDLMNQGDQNGMRICEPSQSEWRSIYH